MSFYSKFAAYYEEIFPFSPVVASFLRINNPEPNSCLDIGCGTGHYAWDFYADGYQVTGIDLDDAMIGYGKTHYPGVEFRCQDMRKVDELGKKYDFVYCIGNTAAHLPYEDFSQFLSDLRSVLVPGCIWILQLMNWDYVLTQDTVRFPSIVTDNNLKFDRTYTHITRESMRFETVLYEGSTKIFKDSVPLYPIASEQIIKMHTDRGFILQNHLGNYHSEPFKSGVFSASIFVFTGPN